MTTKKPTRKLDPLPDTLSGLIDVALADLEKAEKSEKYKINMNNWHCPSNNGAVCSVCFAGSVMAFSLGASPLQELTPEAWWDGLANKLSAINALREGEVATAASELWDDAGAVFYVDNEIHWTSRKNAKKVETFYQKYTHKIPSYINSPARPQKFHAAMRQLSKDLKSVGL